MTVLWLAVACVAMLWGFETWRHRRALRAIPIRIHVNGSRGKSSVTRLIASAINESGKRTFAKTTGSKARMIFPDGREEPVIRLSTPNICEQINVLDRARREKAEVIVMECMAVRPDLQRICEKKIMHSTIGVITNARADHLDVMGPTVADVAVALSSTIPRKGLTVVGCSRHAGLMREVAERRGSIFVVADPMVIPPNAMDGFSYLEHEENVATTLAVTRYLNIPDEVAIRGMHKSTPDVGACTRWHLTRLGREIEFMNAFAANDLESTIAIWQKLGYSTKREDITFALLNLRGDRLDRSLQFAEAVEDTIRADYYFLVGDIPNAVQRQFERQVPRDRLKTLGRVTPSAIFDRIAELSPTRARVGGIGNIGGLGHEILAYVSQPIVSQDGGSSC
ncbi:MAG: poly-gamma-glutamate synthase PgsB [Candidatus Eisenbacteria bacterium]|uniref:Poly-gamma-glutamate synthase PgsB n=1 Tax=Eiseniibacteriota bacterium TaxID=2212470 RepID=A0A948RWJ2_UNCEI|nr:poly-gamma-glutamate synthase PgsB [Candidatus Eisenbacteria bacterium]MBU1948614.1 poly-gamma-glutamate synthase PgsB [Candidatus Eisenbacteria bacterium]MBU2692328.1 poly-gamma-glutamate synthase PgsB [Candidatus Eisenbacteria bacterium]